MWVDRGAGPSNAAIIGYIYWIKEWIYLLGAAQRGGGGRQRPCDTLAPGSHTPRTLAS